MTNQEVFNKVYTHLMAQGRRAYDFGFGCQYRSADGLKCAVGCLIPDEFYNPKMEGAPVRGLMGSPDGKWELVPMYEAVRLLVSDERRELLAEALTRAGVPASAASLLRELQSVHDNDPPGSWARCLAGVAKDFGLEVPA